MSHHKPQISQEWLNRNPFLDIVQENSTIHQVLEFFTTSHDFITIVALMVGVFGIGLLAFQLKPLLDWITQTDVGAAVFAISALLMSYLGIAFLL
ncbi:MAG: hypothetical protein H0Z35_13865 [Thermoanaerobacteraceae bacterium]|nr:hypothetical protein [Thermoanaerobacteraceae bacterium]